MITNNNVIWHNSTISRNNRHQLNKHKSVVIWFTGLSGSGKSTIAHAVEKYLYDNNCRTFVLDGDNVRYGLSSDLSFSDEDRIENIRRIGEVSKLMLEAGIITLTAFISPFKQDREYVRNLLPHGDFIEVFCKCNLEVCETRDPKGLYKKAISGEIKNYTGIDSPYEEPVNPELTIDTAQYTVEQSIEKIINILKTRDII
jgi:adenylylsulfate kinase